MLHLDSRPYGILFIFLTFNKIVDTTMDDVKVRIYRSKASSSSENSIMIYIHGGGYINISKKSLIKKLFILI